MLIMHEPTKSFSESNRCLCLEKSRSRKVNLMVHLPCSWVPTQESQFVWDKSITFNQSISPTSPLLASGIRLSSLMTQFLWCRNLVGCLPMLTCRALHQQFLQSNCLAIYDTWTNKQMSHPSFNTTWMFSSRNYSATKSGFLWSRRSLNLQFSVLLRIAKEVLCYRSHLATLDSFLYLSVILSAVSLSKNQLV